MMSATAVVEMPRLRARSRDRPCRRWFRSRRESAGASRARRRSRGGEAPVRRHASTTRRGGSSNDVRAGAPEQEHKDDSVRGARAGEAHPCGRALRDRHGGLRPQAPERLRLESLRFATRFSIALGWLLVTGPVQSAASTDAGVDNVDVTLRCPPSQGTGRVRCTVEATAHAGYSITWADVVIVSTPPFASPLRGRLAPDEAIDASADRWRWEFALAARTRGHGDVTVRMRAVGLRAWLVVHAVASRDDKRRSSWVSDANSAHSRAAF